MILVRMAYFTLKKNVGKQNMQLKKGYSVLFEVKHGLTLALDCALWNAKKHLLTDTNSLLRYSGVDY